MHRNHRLTLYISALLLALAMIIGSLPEQTALSAPRAQALPTASACEPATAYARAGANVREGPTPDYPLVEQLTAGEVRRIVGRHSGFRWWQVQTTSGGVGWVWDSAVTVTGNVLAVPLVEAPPLNGTIPRTEVVWEMTGIQACIATPTATPMQLAATPQPAVVDWDYTEDGWSLPLNLSQAGAAAQPQLVTLGDDLLVFWEDTFDGFAFSRRRDGLWSAPAVAEFPFFTRRYETDLTAAQLTPRYTPHLLTRTAGDIYAFWRDDEDNLFVSHVAANSFGEFEAWTARQQLGSDIAGLAAAVDSGGAIHLALLQTADVDNAPAGVYVRRLEANAIAWTAAQPLHLSGYYRLMTAETANLQIAVAGDRVFVAWDEQTQERVWLARSADGGERWAALQEIDQRQPGGSAPANSPGAVRLLASGDELHLSWQAGRQGAACAQYHQWSQDGGLTWESVSRLETVASSLAAGCLQDVSLLGDGEAIYLLGSADNRAYLYLWNGSAWTAPHSLQPLSGFTLEAAARQVTLGCGRDAAIHDGRLVVAACGQAVGQDIWLLSQELQSHAALLAATPVWSAPEPPTALVSVEDTVSHVAVSSPLLLADGDGRLHAFWVESSAAERALTAAASGRLYHALRQEGGWSRPQALFADSATAISRPAVALTNDSRLVLLWSGGASGEIYFSWAAAARAGLASEWTEPALFPAPQNAGSAPALAIEPASGMLYAAYALPLNEERGIYLTSSLGAESWAETTLVFDAVAAGWERVDSPRLAVTGRNELHLLFARRSLPGAAPAAELYYVRSADGGAAWTEPEAMNSGTARSGVVIWSDIVVADGRMVHLAWLEWDEASGTRTLWHRLSSDGGNSWAAATRLGSLDREPGAAALLKDPAEGVHLLGLSRETATAGDGSGDWSLEQWQWSADAERWEQAEGLRLPRSRAYGDMAAALTGDGMLAALAVGDGGQFFFAARPVELAAALPAPLPALIPTARPTEPPATPTPRPTDAPVFPTDRGSGESPFASLPLIGSGGLVAGGIVALLAALFIVLVAVGAVSRGRARRP